MGRGEPEQLGQALLVGMVLADAFLDHCAEVFPERQVVLARELTKKFEEFLRGTPAELWAVAQKRKLKGEFVVLVAPAA